MDELSFGIYATGTTTCTLKAWSRTKLVTSHCDAGRNYRNLEDVILQLDLRSFVQSTLYGCPQK
ncbi:hypothetical protein T484DRAFT_1898451 [Baffinella frigidus]|nr:hypothetical protein T484DRAFT_1898451 [Cryptophyta sp. CCMP2293]